MPRRTIEINPFSPKSINSAIMSLRREKKRLEEFRQAFLEELGKLIVEDIKARYHFANAQTPILKNDGYEVTAEITEDGLLIKSSGKSVLFLEFGTGVYSNGSEYSVDSQGWIYPGSYSELHRRTYQIWQRSGGRLYAYPDGSYVYDEPAARAYDYVIEHFDYYVENAINAAVRRVKGK